MEGILKSSVLTALYKYIKEEGIKQNELARKLNWSPQDLSDTLQGRKPIGKRRKAHLKEKLGKSYEKLFLKELAGSLKKKLECYEDELGSALDIIAIPQDAEPLENYSKKFLDCEREYLEKLVTILRKKDKGIISALKQVIDTFVRMPDDHGKTK